MEIHIDDRERAVITHVEDVHEDAIKYVVKRLTVGDYAIMYRGYIMIIIERKTWSDLASSLRDGRSNNINKLLSVRERSGCQLVYLIEGEPCPRPTKKFSRMPAKNLRARLDHIAFRDGIHMVYTLNEKGTAERLFSLAKNLSTIKPSMLTEIDELIISKEEKKAKETTGGDEETTTTTTTTTDQATMLTEKQESRVSVQEQLLMCLPSIGSVVATVMAESGISLLDIYNDLDENTLARLKYPTGNAIGLKKAQKICTNKKHMTSQSIASKKVQVRLLSAVPLISKKTAETILETVEFQNIMDGGVDVDLLKDISRGKSKLGQKASSNIISYLLNKSKKD